MRLLFERPPRRAARPRAPRAAPRLAPLPARRARPARPRRARADPPVGVGPRQRRGVGRPAVAGPARGDGGAPPRHRLGGRRGAARPRALPPLPHARPPGNRRAAGTSASWPARARFRVLDAGFSAILARACLDLADVAERVGEPRVAEESRSAGERVAAALRARAGSDGLIGAVDAVDESPLPVTSAGSALALLAPGLRRQADRGRARRSCSSGALASPLRRALAGPGAIRSARRGTTGAARCGRTSPG